MNRTASSPPKPRPRDKARAQFDPPAGVVAEVTENRSEHTLTGHEDADPNGRRSCEGNWNSSTFFKIVSHGLTTVAMSLEQCDRPHFRPRILGISFEPRLIGAMTGELASPQYWISPIWAYTDAFSTHGFNPTHQPCLARKTQICGK